MATITLCDETVTSIVLDELRSQLETVKLLKGRLDERIARGETLPAWENEDYAAYKRDAKALKKVIRIYTVPSLIRA